VVVVVVVVVVVMAVVVVVAVVVALILLASAALGVSAAAAVVVLLLLVVTERLRPFALVMLASRLVSGAVQRCIQLYFPTQTPSQRLPLFALLSLHCLPWPHPFCRHPWTAGSLHR
jgi:hypothetical protein